MPIRKSLKKPARSKVGKNKSGKSAALPKPRTGKTKTAAKKPAAGKRTVQKPKRRNPASAEVAHLADGLRQGKLSPQQVLLNLIEQIITRHRQSGTIVTDVQEQKLRQLLAGYAAHDPTFAEKIRALNGEK